MSPRIPPCVIPKAESISRDYPYTTVPNQVHRLFRAQQHHDRKIYDERMSATPEQRATMENIDYLRPIIADGDTGHGGLSSVMKMIKLFAESGASAIHLEDQLHGGKKVRRVQILFTWFMADAISMSVWSPSWQSPGPCWNPHLSPHSISFPT